VSIILNDLKTDIFSNINLNLGINEKIAIVGQNGAGKTTLLRTILGLVKSEGDINILGQELKSKDDFKKIYPSIGYLFQDSDDSFIASSVIDEVAFNLYNRDDNEELAYRKASELLEEFGVSELKDKLPIKLSGGQKRVVALCACLVHSPKILLLDEPTNHLDRDMVEVIEKKLKAYDGAMIIIAHNIEFAKRVVDKFYKLENDGLKEIEI
jgi:cobalt/nickel transport system ATP-binding protein